MEVRKVKTFEPYFVFSKAQIVLNEMAIPKSW